MKNLKNVFMGVSMYVVLPFVFIGSGVWSCHATDVVGKDGKVISLEKPKHTAPKVREFTKFYGMMGQDSVFVTKNGKYCLIKPNKKGNGWHAVWLKENK